MLTFTDLNLQNWGQYAGHILTTEKNFPENIQSTREDYERALVNDGLIAKIALFHGEFAGAAICLPFTDQVVEAYEIYSTPPVNGAIYLYSIAIKEAFQGKGIGLALLEELINCSKKKGFTIFAGHFRPNGSFRIMEKLGGKPLKHYPNWSNSGEVYTYCELGI